jgi:hypothetical protein
LLACAWRHRREANRSFSSPTGRVLKLPPSKNKAAVVADNYVHDQSPRHQKRRNSRYSAPRRYEPHLRAGRSRLPSRPPSGFGPTARIQNPPFGYGGSRRRLRGRRGRAKFFDRGRDWSAGPGPPPRIKWRWWRITTFTIRALVAKKEETLGIPRNCGTSLICGRVGPVFPLVHRRDPAPTAWIQNPPFGYSGERRRRRRLGEFSSPTRTQEARRLWELHRRLPPHSRKEKYLRYPAPLALKSSLCPDPLRSSSSTD